VSGCRHCLWDDLGLENRRGGERKTTSTEYDRGKRNREKALTLRGDSPEKGSLTHSSKKKKMSLLLEKRILKGKSASASRGSEKNVYTMIP